MNISAVSKSLKVPTDTLRYYEKIGLFPSVNRTPGGNRDYDETDIKWIQFIKCMREAGIPVKKLVKYVELFQKGDKTRAERKQILINEREELQKRIKNMQQTLDMLSHKIEVYDDIFAEAENNLK